MGVLWCIFTQHLYHKWYQWYTQRDVCPHNPIAIKALSQTIMHKNAVRIHCDV